MLPDTPLSDKIHGPGFFQQFFVLFVRSARNVYRDKGLTVARVFQNILTALIIGFTYFRLGHEQSDAQVHFTLYACRIAS